MRNLSEKHVGLLSIGAAVLYFFSNPQSNHFYDYTFRVAENILRGSIAFRDKPPPWLNEFVPFEGLWYSVFPLGSVLSMLPFALLKVAGVIQDMPSALIYAGLAGAACLLLLNIGARYELPRLRIVLMALAILFGTFTWTNLTMGGAWQLALGFAMVGELGAIYFTVYNRRPILAGAFFALAFGNRTEILLTAPIFLFLLTRSENAKDDPAEKEKAAYSKPLTQVNASALQRAARFCIVPFILGVSTLLYNYVRFGSLTDFGYARIPGVLDEPWYNHGIFSVLYIPRQAWEMLLKLWEVKETFPYLVPNGFSSSILLSSPFILFALRSGSRDKTLKYCAWGAIAVLTILLWMHGNSGGWQFGYRYWTVCLPWLFVILLETAPKRISPLEWAAYVFSFVANLYATWLFHWTSYLRP